MNNHGNPLPSAHELAGMLTTQTLAEVTAALGVNRKAITTKLRRYGMAVGKPYQHYVVKNRWPTVVSAPLKKERVYHPDRVIRITISGAEVTMPRVAFIDGDPT